MSKQTFTFLLFILQTFVGRTQEHPAAKVNYPNDYVQPTYIRYQESPGVNRWFYIDGTGTDGFFAYEPKFYVFVPGSSDWTGPFEWLTYLGTDGNTWKTKIHASTNAITNVGTGWYKICLEWESKKASDGGGNNDTFAIVDWNGNQIPYKLQCPIDRDHSGQDPRLRIIILQSN